MNDRDLSMVGVREDPSLTFKLGQFTKESNIDLADGGLENLQIKNKEI